MNIMKHQNAEIAKSPLMDDPLTVSSSAELNTEVRPNLPAYQQTIYNFLLTLVKTAAPEVVLQDFRRLFIEPGYDMSWEPLLALYKIVAANNEAEFNNTLKRSCYILINNWDSTRQHQAIRHLIDLFPDRITHHTISLKFHRMGSWLNKFIRSKDYEELKIFALRFEEGTLRHWSDRYTSYLLVPQYIERNNPVEQRQAAKTLAHQLKEKFKFELAMYTAHSTFAVSQDNSFKNPTALGEQVIDIIKNIVQKQGDFSYGEVARIFLKQTQDLTYGEFKLSLPKYLGFYLENTSLIQVINHKLEAKLRVIYPEYESEKLRHPIIIKTCQYLIEYLTIENHQQPSELFCLLLSQKKVITLVILLLKIILICQPARTHVEACIADLIQHYKKLPESECRWVINFVDIFNIALTICTEDVEYNLVKLDQPINNESISGIENYRLFSQVKLNGNSDPFKIGQK